MTAAAENMSERLLDLEDIIRPIAIEETRRYLDSRNLVTKDYLDDRIKDLKELFDERLKDGFEKADLKLEYGLKGMRADLEHGLKDVKKSALILSDNMRDGFEKADSKLEYGLKDVKKSALIQTGIVVAAAISLLISIVISTFNITSAIQAKPAVSQTEAPSSQTR